MHAHPVLMHFIFLGTAALFALGALTTLRDLRWLRRLPPLDPPTPETLGNPKHQTRCSVVVAARNEEARVEQTLRRLLAQRGVELELIVVDDRSADQTGEILRRLAKEDSRLRAIRIDALPEGWLGKCHACHLGALAATGEWILFTDADCWSKPDVLLRALQVVEREGADHLTISSGLAVANPGLRAGSLLFYLSLANWFSGVNRDRPKSFLGFGAFNLVRTSAYRQCGGYQALRLTVVDDVKLGLLLRRAGIRTRAFLGADDVEAHWGRNLRDIIPLMEKNYFAALDFRLSLALGVMTFLTLLLGGAVLGALWGTAAGWLAGLSPFFLAVPAAILARRVGWPWFTALGVPFVVPIFIAALANSTFVTLKNGGIRWRDTFYSLQTLRDGNVR